MANPRVVLVADDAAFSLPVQNLLRENAALPATTASSYTDIAAQLTCDSDGLLILAVSSAAEQAHARQLVQRLVLQKWPALVVILDALGPASRLAGIERHVSRRLLWPAQSEKLMVLVRELDRDRCFRFWADE